ncbi:unnamed protein product [Amoebophrya sp. A120]|nr:unnamed protein product [Amoebophrya sp. A120]|eukprot:GSA120T00012955001.1
MATTFLSSLFQTKDELVRDLDFVSACDDEVESDELKEKFARIKMRIEPVHRLEERATAMKYIQETIYDTKKWRKVYNGLRLLERVMQIQILAEEQREGRHFDVVQQCSLLMNFSHEDSRVTNLVRQRAKHVRERCLDLLNLTDTSSAAAGNSSSTAAAAGASTSSSSTASPSAQPWSSMNKSSSAASPDAGATRSSQNGSTNLLDDDFNVQQSNPSAARGSSSLANANNDLLGGGAAPSPENKFAQSGGPAGSLQPGPNRVYANFYQSDKRGAALQNSTGSTICYTKHREDTSSEEDDDDKPRSSTGGPAYPLGMVPPPPGGGASAGSFATTASSAGPAVPPPPSSATTVTDLIDL